VARFFIALLDLEEEEPSMGQAGAPAGRAEEEAGGCYKAVPESPRKPLSFERKDGGR